MRMNRGLAALLVLAALAPRTGAAQKGRSFKDAWFWGLKGGGMSYSTLLETNQAAPSVGLDWVVTRTKGGVYVSYDHVFFDRQTAVLDQDPFSGELQSRMVDLENMRRVSVLAMGFPITIKSVRPYFGIGLTLNHIASAQAQGDYETQDQYLFIQDQINEQKTSFAPSLMLGAQWQVAGVHLFGQGMATSAHRNFFLNDGNGGFTFAYELGVRYNIGRSIER
jgi:hypothetical protein